MCQKLTEEEQKQISPSKKSPARHGNDSHWARSLSLSVHGSTTGQSQRTQGEGHSAACTLLPTHWCQCRAAVPSNGNGEWRNDEMLTGLPQNAEKKSIKHGWGKCTGMQH